MAKKNYLLIERTEKIRTLPVVIEVPAEEFDSREFPKLLADVLGIKKENISIPNLFYSEFIIAVTGEKEIEKVTHYVGEYQYVLNDKQKEVEQYWITVRYAVSPQ